MKWLPLILLAAVPAAIFFLDRLLLWMEWRGWIFYRMTRPDPKNIGPAFLEIEALFQPSKRRVLEQKIQRKKQQDDQGGPDDPGSDVRKEPVED